jgi:hypothetical protein
MPTWTAVLNEINGVKAQLANASPLDIVRRKYLKELAEYTGRATIAYYSGWLSRSPNSANLAISDSDKNALMATVHGLDRAHGLDLILHTPGGGLAAAESLVDYLRRMFGTDIRAIVPQIAMSAGTMIACSCKEIIMGKPSNLGPIDPQQGGVPAHGVIAEFEQAIREIEKNPASLPVWQSIIGKYHPTFIGECRNAMQWAEEIVEQWLLEGMFANSKSQVVRKKIKKIVSELSDHSKMRSHSRHIHIDACIAMGLKITKLEDDAKLQDLVLTTHHAYIQTFGEASHVQKIVENHQGVAMVIGGGSNPGPSR